MRVGLVSEPQYESLVDVLSELHTYYNEGSVVAREVVREHLFENLLGAASPHRLVAASADDGSIVGLAAITLVYSFVDFSADRRKQCQLKELYVLSSARSQGVGRALMSWVARYAYEHGCRRIDWPVKASNARGISFYESLGGERVVDRISYRLSESAMTQLAYANQLEVQLDALQSDRISIRPFLLKDTLNFRAAVLESVETVGNWLPWCHADYSVEDATIWVEECSTNVRTMAAYDLGIFQKDSDRLLGGVSINQINKRYKGGFNRSSQH